jgi:G3E family GTPase
VEFADTLVVSKGDLVGADALGRLVAVLQALNPGAEIVQSAFGPVGSGLSADGAPKPTKSPARRDGRQRPKAALPPAAAAEDASRWVEGSPAAAKAAAEVGGPGAEAVVAGGDGAARSSYLPRFSDLVGVGRFSFAEAEKSPGWLRGLRGDRPTESEEFGISSFVFQVRGRGLGACGQAVRARARRCW